MKLEISNCPVHVLDEWMLVHAFYVGLNEKSRGLLDAVLEGYFLGKIIAQAKPILDENSM